MNLIQAEVLEKDYRVGDITINAIRGVDFVIEAASFVSFVGPSGSGKTTLLNMIGCLDRPSGGRLCILGTDVTALDAREAAGFRGENIGFV
ncbi:MAG: ATP-binding cassette domain-containing protein, partial [Desulfofustis sp.]|nr:ATP-binding cassette domain-containing protein [Desulfofustis sp.]